MKRAIIFSAVMLLSYACADKNKAEPEGSSGETIQNSEISQTGHPTLTLYEQDSIFVSEYIKEWYPANKPNFAELKRLKQYVPSGYLISNYIIQDLNGDGLDDCVMLVSPKDHIDEYGLDIVLLYIRQKDGTLKLHARNETSIPYGNEAYIESDSINGGFIVSTHAAGMGRHAVVTDITSHFTYSKKEKDWFLNYFCYYEEVLGGRDLIDEDGYPIRDEEGNFIQDTTEYEEEPVVTLDNGIDCTKYLTQKDFGKIRFAKFNLESMTGIQL